MSRKRFTPEQIIGMLREAEIRLSQGQTGWRDLPGAWCVRAELLPLAPRVWRDGGQPGAQVERTGTREC